MAEKQGTRGRNRGSRLALPVLAMRAEELRAIYDEWAKRWPSMEELTKAAPSSPSVVLTARSFIIEHGHESLLKRLKPGYLVPVEKAERMLLSMGEEHRLQETELVDALSNSFGLLVPAQQVLRQKRPPCPDGKECHGLLCQGQEVPNSWFEWEKRQGKLHRMRQCRECVAYRKRIYQRRHRMRHGDRVSELQQQRRRRNNPDYRPRELVALEPLHRFVQELYDRLGGREAALRVGISRTMYSYWLNHHVKKIDRTHAAALLLALKEVRRTGERWTPKEKAWGKGVTAIYERRSDGRITSSRYVTER